MLLLLSFQSPSNDEEEGLPLSSSVYTKCPLEMVPNKNWAQVAERKLEEKLALCIFMKNSHVVLWLRHRDTHLLSAGSETYTAESRFRPFQHMYTWGLRISDSRPVDGGIYECQISTTPPISAFTYLNVVVIDFLLSEGLEGAAAVALSP
ncbi:Lachesin [Folsomia candida]|uniref:Lachesin n=1 Tax=Folsomia candida TaxID=158441 RepID=A0A226D3V3_FOLCA|nr:Lachesin [Folsomia candida]